MTDPRLTRWIHASVRQWLEDRKRQKLSTIVIFCEADIRQTNKTTEHLELRIDGPYERKEGTRNEFYADVEVNILVNTTYFENELFRHQNNMGLASYLLDSSIPIFKIGDNRDDKALVGVLRLESSPLTSNFGQIDNSVQVQQGTVEAHFTYEEC